MFTVSFVIDILIYNMKEETNKERAEITKREKCYAITTST